MIERHQDYILTVASVPTSGVQQVPLKLDTDAPFALRLVRSRNIGLSGWKYTTPSTAYQSNALRTDWITPVQQGRAAQPSRGALAYKEMIYPPGSTIMVDIGNTTGAPIANAQLLFRGSKLFKDGTLWVPTYPPKMGIRPAVYQVIVPGVAINAAGGTVLNNQLTIKNDADFVFRAGVCDAYTTSANAAASAFQFTNVYVKLRDEQYKAYSNDWLHVNDVFGQGLPTAGGQDDQVLFTPGLMTPEIYIPRKHNLYFDVQRTDVAGATVDLYFRFIGMKVFAQ